MNAKNLSPSQSRTSHRCPPGSVAWREYRVALSSGATVTLGFSLGDARDRRVAALKKRHTAAHIGLLVILDDPDSIEETLLWLHQASTLALISQEGSTVIGDEVTALLPRYFAAFFDEVKELAPGLADVSLVMPRTGDRRLH